MYRGLIVEKGYNHLKVMTQNMGVKRVKIKEGWHIGQEIYFTREDLVEKPASIRWNYVAAAALFLMVVATAGVWQSLQNSVYSVVSLDINPSVQMSLNRNDKVIEITAMNDDAENIIADEMVGKPVDVVLKMLVENADAMGYFDEEKDVEGNENFNTMLITTVETKKDDDDIDEFLEQLIEEDYPDYNIILLEAQEEELEEAEEEGVSVGIRMLEKLREKSAEMGETERNEISVRAFFYALDDEDLDELAQTEGVHFNQVLMKRAIEMHKQAIGAAKEEREEQKEEKKEEQQGNTNADEDQDSPGNSAAAKDKDKDKDKDNNRDKDKEVYVPDEEDDED